MLMLALGVAGEAWGQEGDPVLLFEEGAAAFKAGELQTAIEKFEQSYALEENPILLYNMARAYEGLDQPAPAVHHYRRYLEADPDTADRGAIEARITALDKELDRRRELEARRKTPPPPPPPDETPSPAPWVVAGVGGLGLVLGGVLGGLSRVREGDAIDEPVALDAADLADQAQTLATGATISLIMGGAVLVGGVTWGIIDLTQTNSDEQARLRLELVGSQLLLTGTF